VSGTVIQIVGEGSLARAVLQAAAVARGAGLGETASQSVATVVSELARNILRYAETGSIQLRPLIGERRGVEVVARDAGPGIADPEQACLDHVSSADSLGLGLPGVKRLMDDFDLQTEVGRGTMVRAVKWA
jgi:serine/threonine-protein kinase RsbT